MIADFTIRPAAATDHVWMRNIIEEHWGAEIVVAHGEVYRPHELAGFIAHHNDEKIGLVTYRIEDEVCEIVTLDSMHEKAGIGTALIEAVKRMAKQEGCHRLWLITTNDNLHALRFYQKRGFVLVAVHRNALDASRKIKPQIPLIGNEGIPLRDEIELEMICEN